MTHFQSLIAIASLALFGGAAHAQRAEPGTGSAQVTPASASPQTSAEPNLRADSKPHTDASATTDSGPSPETLGVGEAIPMDQGLDYSMLPGSSEQRGYTVIYSSKGVRQIPEAPAVPSPVTNPPEPTSHVLGTPPAPPVRHMPTPPSPLPRAAAVIPPR